jgi:hypothetical protein
MLQERRQQLTDLAGVAAALDPHTAAASADSESAAQVCNPQEARDADKHGMIIFSITVAVLRPLSLLSDSK